MRGLNMFRAILVLTVVLFTSVASAEIETSSQVEQVVVKKVITIPPASFATVPSVYLPDQIEPANLLLRIQELEKKLNVLQSQYQQHVHRYSQPLSPNGLWNVATLKAAMDRGGTTQLIPVMNPKSSGSSVKYDFTEVPNR